ncbi:MAG: hypothetical protein U0232_28700 [Thermomicrobiales bacterium]
MWVAERAAMRSRGGAWASWQYSDEDRRLMKGAALTPADSANTFVAWLPIIVAMVGVPILAVLEGLDKGIVIAVGGLLGAFAAMIFPVALSERLRLRRLRGLLRLGLREAAIKPNGLRLDRHFILLTESGMALREVRLEPERPRSSSSPAPTGGSAWGSGSHRGGADRAVAGAARL